MGIGIIILVMCIAGIISIYIWRKLDERLEKKDHGLLKKISIILLIVGFFSVFFLDCFVTVDAGNIGVQNTFGSVSPDELNMGLNIKNPFTDVILYSIKTIELQESSSVPSKEGLIVVLDVSILFKIVPSEADNIYRSIGPYYVDVVIVPQLRSIIREITSKYEAKALYTVGRENITSDIFTLLAPGLVQRGIILEKVLLRDLGLPLTVTGAIEQKLKAEQEAQQMQFILEKETLEAQRKVIEAKGIAQAQSIINSNLTVPYLQWYWIQNLKYHNNTIYIPIGNNGLPIFKPIE